PPCRWPSRRWRWRTCCCGSGWQWTRRRPRRRNRLPRRRVPPMTHERGTGGSNMTRTGIFKGRVQIPYAYGRYGWTRGGGKTWHGGIDLVGLDDPTICMPYYTAADGTQKA